MMSSTTHTLLYIAFPLVAGSLVALMQFRHRLRLLFAIPLALGLVLGAAVFRYRSEIVVVTERDGQLHAERGYVASYDDASCSSGSVCVVNRSSQPIAGIELTYRNKYLPKTDKPVQPTFVWPNTAASFDRIDYVGPDDEPPDSIKGLGLDTTRMWLTW